MTTWMIARCSTGLGRSLAEAEPARRSGTGRSGATWSTHSGARSMHGKNSASARTSSPDN